MQALQKWANDNKDTIEHWNDCTKCMNDKKSKDPFTDCGGNKDDLTKFQDAQTKCLPQVAQGAQDMAKKVADDAGKVGAADTDDEAKL